ncbi:MAG: ABC transporter ATP-binding protein [Candidatus Andersenbacteria bacterium]
MNAIVSVFKAFAPSIKKYWILFGVSILGISGAVLLGTAFPFYTRDIVNEFASATPNVPRVWAIFGTLIWLYIAVNACYRLFDFAVALFQAKVVRDLTRRSFDTLQTQSMHFFENSFTGSVITSAKRFSNAFDGIADVFFYELLRSAVLFIAIFIIISHERPLIALFLAGWMVVYCALILLFTRFQIPLFSKNANADSEVGARLADSISNHVTVASFGQEQAEAKRFLDVVQMYYNRRIKAWFASNIGFALQGILMSSAELGLLWYLITGWQHGNVTAGDFVFYQAYILWMTEQIWSFGPMVQRFFEHVSDAQTMADIFHVKPEIQDTTNAPALEITEGKVALQNVTFSYADTASTIMRMNLEIPAGQSIGLVGRSGSGKSTIVKLLLRFYDLQSGQILIDNQDISKVTQESLRKQLAVVPQDPQMFHSTIRHNISFARPDATEAEIIESAKQAYAWDFIQELPQGLDSIVGERGVKLSGGQRQRIAIARAILANPKILILDEATSALDSAAEKIIQQAIANLLKSRTSIVIAHRLSTIMQLDRIVVIQKGAIIEDGTHQELLARKGEYANLWAHQIGGYIK